MITFDLRQFGKWLSLNYDGTYLYVTTKKHIIRYDGKYCYRTDNDVKYHLVDTSMYKYYRIWRNNGKFYFYNFMTRHNELVIDFGNLLSINNVIYHVSSRVRGDILYCSVSAGNDLTLFQIPIKNHYLSQIIRINYKGILQLDEHNYLSDVICHIGNRIMYIARSYTKFIVCVYDKVKKTTNERELFGVFKYVFNNQFIYVLSSNGIIRIDINLNYIRQYKDVTFNELKIAYNKYLIRWPTSGDNYTIYDTKLQIISNHEGRIYNVFSDHILFLYEDECDICKIPQKMKIDILKKIINNNYKHILRLV